MLNAHRSIDRRTESAPVEPKEVAVYYYTAVRAYVYKCLRPPRKAQSPVVNFRFHAHPTVYLYKVVLKIQHPSHNYSFIPNSLKISTISYQRYEADSNFFLPPPALICFRVYFFNARSHQLFTYTTYHDRNHSMHKIIRLANHFNT